MLSSIYFLIPFLGYKTDITSTYFEQLLSAFLNLEKSKLTDSVT